MNWPIILYYAVRFMASTVILFVALTIMIKIQKLDFKFLAVLTCAAIGAGLDMIPYVGHYIAVPVLWVGIARACNTDMVPDAIFTVGVGYAVVFCINLFVIGALMGDLRPSAREADFAGETEEILPPEGTNAAKHFEPKHASARTNNSNTTAVVQHASTNGDTGTVLTNAATQTASTNSPSDSVVTNVVAGETVDNKTNNHPVSASKPAQSTASTVATNKEVAVEKTSFWSKLKFWSKKKSADAQSESKTNTVAKSAEKKLPAGAANASTNKPAAEKTGGMSKLNPWAKKTTATAQAGTKTNAMTKASLVPAAAPTQPVPSYRNISLRGVSGTSAKRFAMVASGGRNFTVAAGEEIFVTAGAVSTSVKCQEVRNSSAVFKIDGETVELTLP